MGSSYTEFQGKGFWCRDPALEIWLYLLAQEIDTHKPLPKWLVAARDHWHECATVGISGCINADLDALLPDPERVKTAEALAQQILGSLNQSGGLIQREVLNQIKIGGADSYWSHDVEMTHIKGVGEAFVALLRGEWRMSGRESPMLGI